MSCSNFLLNWKTHNDSIASTLTSLQAMEKLTDVTLVCDNGVRYEAHKVILSAVSPIFEHMFSGNACSHPIVFFHNVPPITMSHVLKYAYVGSLQVNIEELSDVLELARTLQLKGIYNESEVLPVEQCVVQPATSEEVRETSAPAHSGSGGVGAVAAAQAKAPDLAGIREEKPQAPQNMKWTIQNEAEAAPSSPLATDDGACAVDEQQFMIKEEVEDLQFEPTDLGNEGQVEATRSPGSGSSRGTYECIHCGRKCDGSLGLKKHLDIHRDELPNKCHTCLISFHSQLELDRHLLAHHETKDPVSEKNGKTDEAVNEMLNRIRSQTALWSEMEAETIPRWEMMKNESSPLECKLHLHGASGRKAFRCPICHKSFGYKASLERHKLIHEKIKPFSCSFCQRGFADRSALKKHELLHAGNRPHWCHSCVKGFVSSTQLEKHLLSDCSYKHK